MTKVFISYSRKDKLFAERLNSALESIPLEAWIDWDDIPPTADWWDQIQKGIEEADGFLFLLSPDSVNSKVCLQELEYAVRRGKRVIPVVVRDVDPAEVDPALGRLNWIFFREQDHFQISLERLKTGIRADFAWVESHSRLLVRAVEWEKRKDNSLLLRGRDLRLAEELLATAEQKDPQPTDLQRRYVLESRQVESRSRNRLTTASSIAVLALTALLIFALFQLNNARASVLAAQAQVAFAGENYNFAALLAYQSNQIHENDVATLVLGKIPYQNYVASKALQMSSGVGSVAWSKDGRLAFSATNVVIWDSQTRDSTQTLIPPDGFPRGVA